MKKMKIKDGAILNEYGFAIGFVSEDATDEERSLIDASGDMAEAIISFVDNINSGTHKPRASSKEFERILDKYNILVK